MMNEILRMLINVTFVIKNTLKRHLRKRPLSYNWKVQRISSFERL